MHENRLGLVSYLLGFEAVFAWNPCENQHFYKKKPYFSRFPGDLEEVARSEGGFRCLKVLIYSFVDVNPFQIWYLEWTATKGGHEFSSTTPRYPWSCAPEGCAQTRMAFILRLCNFDLTRNFFGSELSTAPTAASPASRYKIPDIFGNVMEIYSFSENKWLMMAYAYFWYLD